MSFYRNEPKYPGRGGLRRHVGLVAFLLLLLGGAAAAFFLLFLRGYVIDTPDGPRLQLPLWQAAQQEQTQSVFGDSDAITLPQAPEVKDPLHAVLLPNELLSEGDVQAQLQAAGGNAAIFDMRRADGSLDYVSRLPLAIDSGSSGANPAHNAALRSLGLRPDFYSIARVSCFSDDYLAQRSPELCLQREGGVPFRDTQQQPWLSPSSDAVQTYLTDILRELASLGFDEVLLTNCAYPTQGAKGQSFLGASDREALAQDLERCYRALAMTAQEEGLVLSILWEPMSDDAEGPAANGQSPETLLPLFHRVWVHDAPAATEVFAQRGLSSAALSLIPILDKSGNISASWAKF